MPKAKFSKSTTKDVLEIADEFGYGGAPKVAPAVTTKALHEAHLVEGFESVVRRRIWRIVRLLANPSSDVVSLRARAHELTDLVSAMREAHRQWKIREDNVNASLRDKDPISSPYASEAELIALENAAEEAANQESEI